MNDGSNFANGTFPFNQHLTMIMDGLSHPSTTLHHFHSFDCRIRRSTLLVKGKPFSWKRQMCQRYCCDRNNDRLSSSNTQQNNDKELDSMK